MLDSVDVHNRAAMASKYYVFRYENNAWKTSQVAVASIQKNKSFSYLTNKPRNLISQSFL